MNTQSHPQAAKIDFANILFSGKCNARCPFCIGGQIDPGLNADNLELFPPRNLEAWMGLVRDYNIRQVVFSGTNTDPQLYHHEDRLLELLRKELPQASFSLHTNGRLALRKMAQFNRYDRVCLSLPSFDPATYQRMMGVPGPPDVAGILNAAKPPVKISCIITQHNSGEIPVFLHLCQALGIRRVVLRKPFGEQRAWQALLPALAGGWEAERTYRGNPVYEINGLEVTLWDFERSQSSSLNLFSSGWISDRYLLADAPRAQVMRSYSARPTTDLSGLPSK